MRTRHPLTRFALILLWLLGGWPTTATAAPVPRETEGPAERSLRDATPIHYVATTGTDSGDCSTPVRPCLTIQYAVDQAGESDEIRVAAGTYAEVNDYGGLAQVLYVNKSVTIRGGYTTANWITPDPTAHPTILYARERGRVLYVTGYISSTVEGLRITGGDAAGLGGTPSENFGGGVYVISATVAFRDNQVFDNTATHGGGLYLTGSDVTLTGSAIYANTAMYGGGLYLTGSDATLTSNTISANTAELVGGGLFLTNSDATFTGNTISANIAEWYDGGGLDLGGSDVTFTGNTISANAANWDGGGLDLYRSPATFSGNAISANAANHSGGGLFLYKSPATFSDNTISANTAAQDGGGLLLYESPITLTGSTISANSATEYGGGLDLYESPATLTGNTISANVAAFGGGLALDEGPATLADNTVSVNAAIFGGGLFLGNSDATLTGNTVFANTANWDGGGLVLVYGDATLTGNTISANTAARDGGGLVLAGSAATLTGNTISANAANWDGGGLVLYQSPSKLIDNTISTNTAAEEGGGLVLDESPAALTGNTISANTATYVGGGLVLNESPATLTGNTVSANTAIFGGGLVLRSSDATLTGNTISANTATEEGGGLSLYNSDATLTNNVVTDNQANTAGSGLYVGGSSPRLLHTTIARNGSAGLTAGTGGDGSGVYVTYAWGTYSTAALTNTILVSHTVGITVTPGNTATLETTLWGSGAWANTADWGGDGTVITGTANVWGDPAFVHPDSGDYHIGPGSAAVDAGVDAGVPYDIDGDPRTDGYPDLGADEVRGTLVVTKRAEPDPVQAGGQLTYTIRVTNTGNVDLHTTITDTLPTHVTQGQTPGGTIVPPGGQITWTPTIPAPGGVWTETVVVTVELGYAGTLTNVVRVTTAEGATGVYTETSEAEVTPMLEVTKRAEPDPVQAGAQLTYTIRVTNTGNVDLHATITDTLPTHITQGQTPGGTTVPPGGQITWTPAIPAPGGVWTETVVVTVELGYAGTLTNVVRVTTDEGATGVYTETSEAEVTPTLEVTKRAEPDPVQAGAQLTYTIRVANTGNVDLHATVTDTLPAQVTPPGPLTWTTGIIVPGDAWAQQVVVTVEMDYAGPLTNVVQVTTDEGATGVYTETSTAVVERYSIYLPLVLRNFP